MFNDCLIRKYQINKKVLTHATFGECVYNQSETNSNVFGHSVFSLSDVHVVIFNYLFNKNT